MNKYTSLLFALLFVFSCSTSRKLMDSDIMDMNSTYYLVNNNTWNLISTDHFKFYFDKAIPETSKQAIMDAQEKNFSELAKLMGLTEEDQSFYVSYWLFKDRSQKRTLTKVDSDAHVLSSLNAVYHLPKNAKGGQELGHLLTQKFWGFIPKTNNYSLVIDEGFNYYIDDERFYGGKLKAQAQGIISSKNSPDIINLITRNKGEKIAGVSTGSHLRNESIVAGAFIKFLIQEYGIEKFQKLWKEAVKKEKADIKILESIYKVSPRTLNDNFLKFLKK